MSREVVLFNEPPALDGGAPLHPLRVSKRMLVKLLKHTTDPEKTCALAARLCYTSVSIDELTKKLTPVAVKDLLLRIISSGHNSVLEHASFTFAVEGVSRALLAQLTRHRIASFSVQSQRYVKFKDSIEFIVPPGIEKNKQLCAEYRSAFESAKILYDKLLSCGIAAEDARYALPQSAPTKIIMTMNARELRHFFALRCCNRAQWEIREMSCRMLSQAKKAAPLLFAGSGPDCVRDSCKEEKPCGEPWARSLVTVCRERK